MELRKAIMVPPSADPSSPDPSSPDPHSARFRIDGRLTAVKLAVLALVVLVEFVAPGDARRTVFAGVAAVVLAGYAARDLIAPTRLAADREAVTVVTGYARRHRLRWDQIEGVRLDRRSRLGLRSEFLEIDTGESLYLFSSYDLGVSPAEALAILTALAPAA